MEDKLNEYRVRKRRQEVISSIKDRFFKMISPKPTTKTDVAINLQVEDDKTDKSTDNNSDTESLVTSETTSSEPAKRTSWITYCTYLVYFLFWATLYAIAIKLAFGLVYFMLSLLLGLYFNTRTEPRKENEPSAYSVFNENCESLDGTFKAENFERQLGLRQL